MAIFHNENLESNREKDPSANEWEKFVFIISAVVLGVWVFGDIIVIGADQLSGNKPAGGYDILGTFLSIFNGKHQLTIYDVLIAGGMLLVVGVLFLLYLPALRKNKKHKVTRVDRYAKSMGYGKAINGILETTTQAKAERLVKHQDGVTVTPGIPLGKLVYNGEKVYSDWEAMVIVVAGPRTGKSVGYVIPTICSAPGPVIATSNKRDIVDATAGIRETDGRKIWLFDPENIANGEATWYWDPLMNITELSDAKRIADCWRASAGLSTSEGNAEFFNGKAAEMLTNFLFAAQLDHRPIRDIFTWANNEKNSTAAEILAKNGYDALASAVYGRVCKPLSS